MSISKALSLILFVLLFMLPLSALAQYGPVPLDPETRKRVIQSPIKREWPEAERFPVKWFPPPILESAPPAKQLKVTVDGFAYDIDGKHFEVRRLEVGQRIEGPQYLLIGRPERRIYLRYEPGSGELFSQVTVFERGRAVFDKSLEKSLGVLKPSPDDDRPLADLTVARALGQSIPSLRKGDQQSQSLVTKTHLIAYQITVEGVPLVFVTERVSRWRLQKVKRTARPDWEWTETRSKLIDRRESLQGVYLPGLAIRMGDQAIELDDSIDPEAIFSAYQQATRK